MPEFLIGEAQRRPANDFVPLNMVAADHSQVMRAFATVFGTMNVDQRADVMRAHPVLAQWWSTIGKVLYHNDEIVRRNALVSAAKSKLTANEIAAMEDYYRTKEPKIV